MLQLSSRFVLHHCCGKPPTSSTDGLIERRSAPPRFRVASCCQMTKEMGWAFSSTPTGAATRGDGRLTAEAGRG